MFCVPPDKYETFKYYKNIISAACYSYISLENCKITVLEKDPVAINLLSENVDPDHGSLVVFNRKDVYNFEGFARNLWKFVWEFTSITHIKMFVSNEDLGYPRTMLKAFDLLPNSIPIDLDITATYFEESNFESLALLFTKNLKRIVISDLLYAKSSSMKILSELMRY